MGNENSQEAAPRITRDDLALTKILISGSEKHQKVAMLGAISPSKDESLEDTMGADFRLKAFKIGTPLRDLKLQYWITSNEARYKDQVAAYHSSVHIGVFLYDPAKPETFAYLKTELAQVRKQSPLMRPIIVALTGENTALTGEAMQLARENNSKFCQASPDNIKPLDGIVAEILTDLWNPPRPVRAQPGQRNVQQPPGK